VKPQVVIERQPEDWIKAQAVPRVTSICRAMDKPALVPWAAGEAAAYMGEVLQPGRAYSEEELATFITAAKTAHWDKTRKAADKGTAAHKWIQSHCYGLKQPMPEDPDIASSVNAYLEWLTQHEVEYVESEFSFVRRLRVFYQREVVEGATPIVLDIGYKGTLDALAWVDGVFTLVDFKTGKGVYTEAHMQTAAYQKGAENLIRSGQKIEQRIILHVPKDGRSANPITLTTDLDADFAGFLNCYGMSCYIDYQKAATARR